MGTYAALDHTTWVAGYDMTGDSNETNLKLGVEPKDRTVFGNHARNRLGGLHVADSTVNGFWDTAANAVDPTIFAGLTGLKVVTQSWDGSLGAIAYAYQAVDLSYTPFGEVGEVVPFSLELHSARGAGMGPSVGAVRGQVCAIKQTVSGTGAVGAGVQIAAVSSGQYLYSALHLFSAGTTITAVLESDDNSNFTSATTRATLGPLTTTGGTWATRVAGAITDTFYRYRVTAITGSFLLAAFVGIK